MPSTRAQLDLNGTSIRDHLLIKKSGQELTIKPKVQKDMDDQKNTPSTSGKDFDQSHDTVIEDENVKGENIHPQRAENENRATTMDNQHIKPMNGIFFGEENEDAGLWLDHMFTLIEQKESTPMEQRNMVTARLAGKALLWYRLNRLKMPDVQSFVEQFLSKYKAPSAQGEEIEREEESSKITNGENQKELIPRSFSTVNVLQSAKNEKVKLFPNFSGTENSLNWLKNLQQIGKSLQLDDQQIFELATIKLSGPAQEWFYHQSDEINDWLSFKQLFLHAFPSPIQPTKIDYLAQLLARKQGETEPVGKFVQDINRLCLKLEEKITEQDKLQYLRRGLRPQLQHHALAITSLQDFLMVMQRHEQIEKDNMLNQCSSGKTVFEMGQKQQNSLNQRKWYDYDYQQGPNTNKSKSSERQQNQNYNNQSTTRFEKENRVCYQCNKRGHLQWDCPDNQPPQQRQTQQLSEDQQELYQYQQVHQQQPAYQYPQQAEQQHFQRGGY